MTALTTPTDTVEAGAVERLTAVAANPGSFGGIQKHRTPVRVDDLRSILAQTKSQGEEIARLRAEREVLAQQFNSLVSPSIEHKGAKQRLMSMRRALFHQDKGEGS